MSSGAQTPCGLCWSMVPAELMASHRAWHGHLRTGSAQSHDGAPLEAEIRELVDVVAAVKRVPRHEASREFVSNLREQLMAEALQRSLDEPTPPTPTPVWPVESAAPLVPRPRRSPRPSPTAPAPRARRSRVVRVGMAVVAIAAVATGADLTSHWTTSGLFDDASHPSSIVPHPHLHGRS